MKAVILAAGMGTRLGTLIPKPLTAIENEKVIIDYQVAALKDFIGLHNIFVVVGYKKELIMERHPQLIYIYNERYVQTNTSKSLLTAVLKINDDVLWMNGDVYFDKNILELVVASKYSACLVDQKECGAEEIKYNLNQEGFIYNLSKNVKDPQGEALGVNLIFKKDLDMFREELNTVNDNDYFEKALENLTLSNKLKITPINVGNLFCKEIDFEEDLLEVQNEIRNFNKKLK